MRKYIALFLALALACTVGLALAEADVTGPWYTDLGGAAAELTLNADGTYRLTVPLGEENTGTWKFDDGFVYLDGASTPDLATWGENTLVLGDSAGFFTREKPAYYAPADPLPDAPLDLFAGYWVCQYVEVNGSPVLADYAADRTDLYIEGHSGILGGPRFGDAQVKLTFADGALTCEHAGTQVTLLLQQDDFLRLTTAPDAAALYLLRAAAPDEDLDEDLDDTP
ncbi:MAG: hypothetical protein GX637_05735 [Clostridiales bacterium]|nr:hypothetical protein [Clostridiales bacterium]